MASENCSKCGEPIKPMRGDEPASEWEHHCAAPSRGEGARQKAYQAGSVLMPGFEAGEAQWKPQVTELVKDHGPRIDTHRFPCRPENYETHANSGGDATKPTPNAVVEAGEAGQPPARCEWTERCFLHAGHKGVHHTEVIDAPPAPQGTDSNKFAGERADSPDRLPSPVTQRTAMTSPAIQPDNDATTTPAASTAPWLSTSRYFRSDGVEEFPTISVSPASRLSASERLAPQQEMTVTQGSMSGCTANTTWGLSNLPPDKMKAHGGTINGVTPVTELASGQQLVNDSAKDEMPTVAPADSAEGGAGDLEAAAEQNIALVTENGRLTRMLGEIAEQVAKYPTVTGLQEHCINNYGSIRMAISDAQSTWQDTVKRLTRETKAATERAEAAERERDAARDEADVLDGVRVAKDFYKTQLEAAEASLADCRASWDREAAAWNLYMQSQVKQPCALTYNRETIDLEGAYCHACGALKDKHGEP